MRRLVVACLLILVHVSIGASETQTDWSGGSGVPGPVTTWGDMFNSATGASFCVVPGILTLSFGSCTPVLHTVVTGMNGPRTVSGPDMDGDGDPDILATSEYTDQVYWMENGDGVGGSWIPHVINGTMNGPTGVASADIDGDGDLDVAATGYYDGLVTWWENTNGIGTSWIEHGIATGFSYPLALDLGDLDGDGDQDLVANSLMIAGGMHWWENENGLGTSWTERTVVTFGGGRGVRITDLNQDGDMDLLTFSYNSDWISWWENEDGSGTNWTNRSITTSFNGPEHVEAGDLDGDGDLDVVAICSEGGQAAWWANANGQGTSWVYHLISSSVSGGTAIFAGQIDGDGSLDLATTRNTGSESCSWWANNGSGTGWTQHIIYGPVTYTVSVEDLDSDGTGEVLFGSYSDGGIHFADVTQFGSSGELYGSILDTGCDPDWGSVDWNVDQPEGTDMALWIRASDNSSAMGSWIVLDTPGQLPTYLDGLRYFQYRVLMSSTDSTYSPLVDDISLEWIPLSGTAEGQGAGIPSWGLSLSENPVRGGAAVLTLSAAEAGPVSLRVFDLSGRVIAESEVQAVVGLQTVSFHGLPAGAYHCAAEASGYAGSIRVVVID